MMKLFKKKSMLKGVPISFNGKRHYSIFTNETVLGMMFLYASYVLYDGMKISERGVKLMLAEHNPHMVFSEFEGYFNKYIEKNSIRWKSEEEIIEEFAIFIREI